MSRVKICGLRREDDIRIVNRVLPDYIGFVFAPSQRQVDVPTAAALKKILDPRIEAVGVFVNESIETIAELYRNKIIDLAQLHGDEDEAYIARLKERCGCPIIKAVRVGNTLPPLPDGADYLLFDTLPKQCDLLVTPTPSLRAQRSNPEVKDAALPLDCHVALRASRNDGEGVTCNQRGQRLDTPTPSLRAQRSNPEVKDAALPLDCHVALRASRNDGEGVTCNQRGGTGQAFDWNILTNYTGLPYFLSGGLGVHNVSEAIKALSPYCVDVSSGVESDGVKNEKKIDDFVHLVRGC